MESDQSWLFPPSPQDWLPDGHLVYFLMDVGAAGDSEKGGKPPYHPRMMLVLLLYSYCIGVFSSRKIVAATHNLLKLFRSDGLATNGNETQRVIPTRKMTSEVPQNPFPAADFM